MVNRNQRNYGIDLLRIVSMMMICVLHILQQGGAMGNCYYNIYVARIPLAMCFGAVNCFALISGYVGVESKVKLRNIIRLWLQVVFYCATITLTFHLLGVKKVGYSDLKRVLLPALTNQYWYFTAYFFLFFFIPYLNYLINSLSQKTLLQLSISIIFVFSILQMAASDIFPTYEGYCLWWIMLLYLLGACLKRMHIVEKIPRNLCLLTYVIGATITLLFPEKLQNYVSPTVLIGSMALLLWFSKLNPGNWMCKVISKLAPLSFGVYLIHVHPLIFKKVITGLFIPLSSLRTRWIIIALPLCVLGLYTACTLIDGIRSFLFRKLGINRLCEEIEKIFLQFEKKMYGKILENV